MLIGTRRTTYGKNFADGCSDHDKLSGVLHTLDPPCLTKLIHDHDAGRIAEIR